MRSRRAVRCTVVAGEGVWEIKAFDFGVALRPGKANAVAELADAGGSIPDAVFVDIFSSPVRHLRWHAFATVKAAEIEQLVFGAVVARVAVHHKLASTTVIRERAILARPLFNFFAGCIDR